jgi:hypothetical protein
MSLIEAVIPKPEVHAKAFLLRAADKRPIYVCTSLVEREYLLPDLRQTIRQAGDEFVVTDRPPPEGGWALAWYDKARPNRCSVVETGFWFKAMHIDAIGLYKESMLNTPEILSEIAWFKAPRSAADIVLSQECPQSKYKQNSPDRYGVDMSHWDGVVLPLQMPHDRSVTTEGEPWDFWKFVEGAAKKYGKHLLLKQHPLAGSDQFSYAQRIANQHGCTVALTDHSCLKKCKFVIVYTSSFSVDAMIRGVRVAQFKPGYFYRTGAVEYTAGEYPDDVPDRTEQAQRLCDWMIWRYCFNFEQPGKQWVEMLRSFAGSTRLAPLPPEYSYAMNLQYAVDSRKTIF